MYKEGDKCPTCGVGVLKYKSVEETFVYNGERTTHLQDFSTFKCDKCNAEVFDHEKAEKLENILKNIQMIMCNAASNYKNKNKI